MEAAEATPARNRRREADAPADGAPGARNAEGAQRSGGKIDWRKPQKRRGKRRRRGGDRGPEGGARGEEPREPEFETGAEGEYEPQPEGEAAEQGAGSAPGSAAEGGAGTRSRRRRRRGGGGGPPPDERREGPRQGPREGQREGQRPPGAAGAPARELEGMFVLEHGGIGVLRRIEAQFVPSKEDVFVPQRLIAVHKLREGSIVRGRVSRGQKHKFQLVEIVAIDGESPRGRKETPVFKNLTTIDPDFHYAVGDVTGDVSMRVLDILCPVGRGQRGLIVAPPRAGKTTIMRQFAKGIEEGYPDVELFVLLVDERPEEATEWQRSTKGQVFVSTSDETPKKHVALAEAVWKRCLRLVELGKDVVLLLDSITRLARAYNNLAGGSGRTMSGGLDSRAMERPRQIFGSARNTETAGSLTILGTTLVETGSRMDQLIFEEFKGTGNMELVLSRKLADRRIFPAIDIERSGTRKDEKIVGAKKLKRMNTLRRVLTRMNFVEAMELLQVKLAEVSSNDEFLKRFEVDPEA